MKDDLKLATPSSQRTSKKLKLSSDREKAKKRLDEIRSNQQAETERALHKQKEEPVMGTKEAWSHIPFPGDKTKRKRLEAVTGYGVDRFRSGIKRGEISGG